MAGRSRAGAAVAIAVLAIVVAIAVVVTKNRSGQQPERQSEAAPGTDGDARSPATAARPRVPAQSHPATLVRMHGDDPETAAPDDEKPLPPGQAFEAESVDPERATKQADLVRERIDKLAAGRHGVEVPTVECRTHWCRVVVVGQEESEFRALVESMQDERGFLGLAESFSLERMRRDPEGRISVDVLLRF